MVIYFFFFSLLFLLTVAACMFVSLPSRCLMVYDVSLLRVLSLLSLKIFIFVSFKMNTVFKKLH